MDSPTAACPSPEVLAAYIDDGLTRPERDAVDGHLDVCEDCRVWLAEVLRNDAGATDVAETPHKGTGRGAGGRGWSSSVIAAGLLAASVVLAVGWWMIRGSDSDLQLLVDASGATRVVEGRLSGGFPYAPYEGPLRAATQDEGNLDLRAAAVRIIENVDAEREPRVVGIAHLLLGEANEAVNMLQRASADSPTDAAVLSDLAVALVARSRTMSEAADLRLAREAIGAAVAADATSPTVLFNRAWILEVSGDTSEAIAAWADYLGVDATSAWADEVRRRVAVLESTPAPSGSGSLP